MRGTFASTRIKITGSVPSQRQLSNHMKKRTGQEDARSIGRQGLFNRRFAANGQGPHRCRSLISSSQGII